MRHTRDEILQVIQRTLKKSEEIRREKHTHTASKLYISKLKMLDPSIVTIKARREKTWVRYRPTF